MLIGVSSYSFNKMIKSGQMSQLTLIKKAKQLGFELIEFTDLMPEDGMTEAKYAQLIAKECASCGIKIGAYTVSADLLNGCEGDFDKEVERVKRKVDVAEILGCKLLRHDAAWGVTSDGGKYLSFDSVLQKLAQGCREITLYAKEKGIRTMVENHGFFAQDSDRVENLITAVNDENFGALVDIGNFLCVDESPETAVGRLAPYAFNVHVKDFNVKTGSGENPGDGWFKSRGGNYLKGTIVGHGEVPVKKCLSIIKKAGYDGNYVIEFEGLEENIPALETGLSNLKRYLEKA